MKPTRIASLLASATEFLYALGLGDRVVAVSHECDYPADVAGKPRVTRTRVDAAASSGDIDRQVQEMAGGGDALYDIDVDQLARLRPELIVTQAQCDVCAVRYEDVVSAVRTRTELAGAKVVALNPSTFADILDDVRRVGEAAGKPQAAEELAGNLSRRVDAVREKTASLPAAARPRVLGVEWLEPLMASGNWLPDMIEMAGGTACLTEAGGHSPYVIWEQILDADPQVMLLMPCGFDLWRTLEERHLVTQRHGWDQISAARTGRVYAVDGNQYFNRSGPRMVDSLELLAHLTHPEIFAAPEMERPDEVWRRV